MAGLLDMLGATASSCGMDAALSASSDWVTRYITQKSGASLHRQIYSETVRGSGRQSLMVNRLPLSGVQRLFNSTTTADATEFCSTDFRIESQEGGLITRTNDAGYSPTTNAAWNFTRNPRPTHVLRPWLVVYEAGWQFAESSSTCMVTTSTGRSLPFDVEHAVLIKASNLYQGGGDVSMMKVGPLELNYSSEGQDEAEMLLTPYRWEGH